MVVVPTPHEMRYAPKPDFDEVVNHFLRRCVSVLSPNGPRTLSMWGVSSDVLDAVCKALEEKGWSATMHYTPYPELLMRARDNE